MKKEETSGEFVARKISEVTKEEMKKAVDLLPVFTIKDEIDD